MTRIIMTAAAAIALASPVLAGPSTPLEIRQHLASGESGNQAIVFTGGTGINERAAMIFAQIARQDDMRNMGTLPDASDFLNTENSVVNNEAARIFRRLDAEDEGSN